MQGRQYIYIVARGNGDWSAVSIEGPAAAAAKDTLIRYDFSSVFFFFSSMCIYVLVSLAPIPLLLSSRSSSSRFSLCVVVDIFSFWDCVAILCNDCLLIRLLHGGADKRIPCCCDLFPVILWSDIKTQRYREGEQDGRASACARARKKKNEKKKEINKKKIEERKKKNKTKKHIG